MFKEGMWVELACLSNADVLVSIYAMEELLSCYYSGTGLSRCPLCAVIEECFMCPWVIISGYKCFVDAEYSVFDGGEYNGIEKIRMNPENYPDQVASRIEELERWIHIYYAEAYVRASDKMKVSFMVGNTLNCPKCGGSMEAHINCSVHGGTHWYCLTANCGTIVKI